MDKHGEAIMTEEEWFDFQYENYLETQASVMSYQNDKIEHELERMLAPHTQVSQHK